jgi:hypothetical protein
VLVNANAMLLMLVEKFYAGSVVADWRAFLKLAVKVMMVE